MVFFFIFIPCVLLLSGISGVFIVIIRLVHEYSEN